ncbi:estrogen receptor beta isoform X1 [Amblyraja radiata]|uniref:estrogen receptor beta isoform X1 n=2 Tax=Amblyraja radiata TaxID=386614 RepID=UPI001403C58D|nr:estrogen receptor beta isoform X1 [Amblyraja radiata]
MERDPAGRREKTQWFFERRSPSTFLLRGSAATGMASSAAATGRKEPQELQEFRPDGPELQLKGSPAAPQYGSGLPGLSEHGPVCMAAPYGEGRHDYPGLAFYSPSLLGYEANSDGPYVRQSLSPSLYWSASGHLSPIALHCQTPLVYTEPSRTPWGELRPGEQHTPREGVKKKLPPTDSANGVCGRRDAHYCAVCNDFASGYHYGVWSCEGCKAFFKRSIQGHNAYICPATNQCTIDKNRRKSCQACRLRKCYEVGMMKSDTRRDRCSYRLSRQSRLGLGVGMGVVGGVGMGVGGVAAGGGKVRRVVEGVREPGGALGPLAPERLLTSLLEAEPPNIYSLSHPNKPYTEASMMMSLTNLADRELVHMIAWAKKVPGFVELDLHDQVQLLECCWLEVLMVGLMWRSMDYPGKLLFAPDLILDRDEGQCVEGILEIFDMLLAATARFRELKLQHDEYLCLKAMVLLNSSMFPRSGVSDEQENREKLHKILDTITDTLIWCMSRSGVPPAQQPTRLAHLLMLLSHIRHASNKGMEHLYSMKCKNVVPFYDLLLEMLDAHVIYSYRKPPDDTNCAPAKSHPL